MSLTGLFQLIKKKKTVYIKLLAAHRNNILIQLLIEHLLEDRYCIFRNININMKEFLNKVFSLLIICQESLPQRSMQRNRGKQQNGKD